MAVDTLPKFLLENFRKYPHAVSMRKKKFGIWNTFTWEECYQNIKDFAQGLVSLGLQEGDKVCIIGDNDPEWFWAALAAQSLGAVIVGLNVSSIPAQVHYIAEHSDSVFAIVKDQEQVDKFLEIKERLPKLKKVIYWDPRGMWAYADNPWIMEFRKVMTLGEIFEKDHAGSFEEGISRSVKDDVASICYSSENTEFPRGFTIGHDMLIEGATNLARILGLRENDEYLSFVSPSRISEQQMGIAGWLVCRFRINFPEAPETVIADLREIGVHFFLLGSRQWENLLSIAQTRINDTTWIRRLIYDTSMSIGYKVAEYVLNKRCDTPLIWKGLYQVANMVCFRWIKDYFGLKKLKMGIISGLPLGPDTIYWFRAIGVNVSGVYGLSEATPLISHGRDLKVGTIGRPLPGVEVRISDEGEMLIKAPTLFKGYYKETGATQEKWVDGWLSTGDACLIDEDGHLTYLGRIEDLLELKEGAKYSPTYIENRFKFSPYIKEALIVGNRDNTYLLSIININFDNVRQWAEKHQVSYKTYGELSQKPEVYDLILQEIISVNRMLPENAQVKKFVNVPEEFDPNEGELPRTGKLKQSFIEQRYRDIIDAAYSEERTFIKKTLTNSIVIRSVE